MGTLLTHPSGLRYRLLVGVGGIGTGLVLALEGDDTLGRNESRAARLLDARDYCKLHIITHYVAVLLGPQTQVVPVGKVGDDDAGHRLLAEMASAGLDTRHIEVLKGGRTLLSVCFQYPDGSGGNLTTNASAASRLTAADVDRCTDLLTEAGRHCIALAVPEAPLDARDYLLKKAGAANAFRAASFTSAEIQTAKNARMISNVDLLAINQEEAQTLVGDAFNPAKPQSFLDRCASVIQSEQPACKIIVTAGKHGAFAFADSAWEHRIALDVPVASAAGAGDALLAGTLSGLALGLPFTSRPLDHTSAFDLGMLLAAYSVTSPHTIHPDANRNTLRAFAHEYGMHTQLSYFRLIASRRKQPAAARSRTALL